MPKGAAVVGADDIGDELLAMLVETESLSANEAERIAARQHTYLFAGDCELGGHPTTDSSSPDDANVHIGADGLR
jgi:hypothetical protein